MADLTSAARALHVIFATLRTGGVLLMTFFIGPTLAAAGPAGGPFMAALLRRGGTSPYFLTVGLGTILTGGYIYHRLGYTSAPFATGASVAVTIGAILALGAIGHGAAVLGPNLKKMKAVLQSIPPGVPAPPEVAAKLQALGGEARQHTLIGAVLIGLALLAMTLRVLF